MKTNMVIKAKGKFFSSNPSALQQISDILHNEYLDKIATSRPTPTSQGDYFILITIYGEESQT